MGQPLRYTGREFDEMTGLYQYRARWYDPQLARFISQDPIGLAGGINPYAYAAGDPVNMRDPSGLCTVFGSGASMPTVTASAWGYSEPCAGSALPEQAPLEFGPRPGTDGLTTGWKPGRAEDFGDGVGSYFNGLYQFGRHALRRYGWLGECEQAMVAVEEVITQRILSAARNNPRATLDIAVDYARSNPYRVAGRVGTGIVVAKGTGGWGGFLSLAAVIGDARHAVEQGVDSVTGMIPAVLGGTPSGGGVCSG